ncbi:MAG: DUF1003 domain-containing protein [Fimbriimonadaceae bacterium]
MLSAPESPEPPTNPTIIGHNVDAVLAMHSAEELAITGHQRAIERMVSVVAVPGFLFAILGAIIFWIGINVGLMASGHRPLDKPPFGWLQTVATLVALVMTSVVVITQNRQGKVAERNAHVDLQVNLLVDQKAGKIIQLLEEIRTESPTLRNRRDSEADELQLTFDPGQVATIIAEKSSAMISDAENGADGA